MKNQYNLPCNIAQTLNIIGDKWSLLILHQIFSGNETYKEILDALETIPTNLLSERLKNLESDELINRDIYQCHPPRYKYTLTEKGSDLEDVFISLALWGERHLNKCYKKLVHDKCDNLIEHKYYCPICNKYLNKDELKVMDSKNNISEV
ncbi:MAG: ytcD 1 [Bacillota bacterium]|jgi:DNA-binding HxlR family transcriptional regulator|nr:ytcD 1 [Bacillota bacterium]